MEWYYVKDGASCGPVDRHTLSRMAGSGELKPGDLVWNSTMGEAWVRADSVKGLFTGVPGLKPSAVGTMRRDLYEPQAVGLIEPAQSAWHRMVVILFRPFDFTKWFVLGFSGWLATLGESGGSFNTGGTGTGGASEQGHITVDGMLSGMEETWGAVREFWVQYGGFLVAGIVLAVLVMVSIGIGLLWVRCRGKFMFLDNVLKNRAEINEPWQEWQQHAQSLFWWSLGFAVICSLIFFAILGLSWPLVWKPMIDARAFVSSMWGGIATIVLLVSVFGFVTYYIRTFLTDFVVPIMYRHDLTATEAWRKFLELYHANITRFLTYGLFLLVLQLGAGMVILAAVVVTCFLAGCLMMIPYIGSVLLLPVTVFFRLYGVEYLAQYGGDFVIGAAGVCDE